MFSPDTTGDPALETPISRETMGELLTQGLATLLSQHIEDHVRYHDRWWIADREGWHLVDDQRLHEMLDVQSKWIGGNIYRRRHNESADPLQPGALVNQR